MTDVVYSLTAAAVAGVSALVHHVFSDVMALSDQKAAASARSPLAAKLPERLGTVLGFNGELATEDLRGRTTLLLFLDPADGDGLANEQFVRASTLHFLNQMSGRVFVVCGGNQHECVNLLERSYGHVGAVPCVWDASGELATQLRISRTPAAVVVDDTLTIVKAGYGRPALPAVAMTG